MRRVYVSGGESELVDEIYEVYYDDDGNVVNWTENPVGPSFYVGVDEGDGIVDSVKRFLRACDKPTLDYETGKEIEK
jgi:hypothetical protein